MHISHLPSRLPARQLINSKPPRVPGSADHFKSSPNPEPSTLKTVLKVSKLALPVAAGVYAGLAGGTMAAFAGALAATPGAAALGAFAGGLIGKKVFGASEAHTVGAALFGTAVGAAAGLAGGAYLGAAPASPWAAVGLGVLGCLTSGVIYLNLGEG